jgi:2-polyprenyl-3-methyl-5-hydroxy-6-metoxy-1,4-benzoquinol methylase
MRAIIYIYIILVSISCSHKKHHHGHANHVMNQKVFEDLVKAFESPERESYQKPNLVIASMGDIRKKNVIDIGAGTGYFSFRMAKKGAYVTHADVDDRFIDFANEKSKKIGVSKNFKTLKIPYDDPQMGISQYDIALLVNTYHHIEDRTDYFKKVKDGLINGGQLVIVDFKKPKNPSEPNKFPREEMRISVSQIKEELATCGFTSFKVDNRMLPYQFVLYAR